MRNALTALSIIISIIVMAGDQDLTIRVHKAPVITLVPGITTIYNDTVYTFGIRGLKRGMIAEATMNNTKVLEVMDTLLFVKTKFPRTVGPGFDTAKVQLKLKVTDRISNKEYKVERTFTVYTKRIPPVISPPRSGMRWGTYINKEMGDRYFRVITLRSAPLYTPVSSRINAGVEWQLRRYGHLGYFYVDGNTKGTTRAYRAMDLIIYGPLGDLSYHAAGNVVSSEMRKSLRQQKGKSNFKFILYKQPVRGDSSATNSIDTISYERYKVTKSNAVTSAK